MHPVVAKIHTDKHKEPCPRRIPGKFIKSVVIPYITVGYQFNSF